MKVYHVVALSALALPAAAGVPAAPAQAVVVSPVVSPGPVMGTVVNPGPIGPVHGTIINPGAGGRTHEGHQGHHRPRH